MTGSKIRILHLEDTDTDIETINRILKNEKIEFESYAVDTREDYVRALTEFRPDIILSDHSLPSFNSVEALNILKLANLEIPFILITGAVSEEFAAQIIKQGADDYILKDRPWRLPASILNALQKYSLAREKKKSEAYVKNIFDKSVDVLCCIDADGKFSEVSKSASPIWGYEPAELLGKPYIDLVLEEDKEVTIQKASEIKNGIDVTNFQNRNVRKDGEIVPIVWSATWDDNTRSMYCIARDATEKMKVEKAVQDAQKQYIDLVNNLPAAVYSCNTEGKIILYNHAAEALWGRKPIADKDLWCGSWQIFSAAGEPVSLDNCPMAKTLKTGVAMAGEETIIKRPDGTFRYVQPYPIPTFDSKGILTGAVNMLIDITERKIAEKEVQKNLELLRSASSRQSAILDALPANIALLNGEGTIVDVNQAWIEFAKENNLQSFNYAIGENYIAISKNAGEEDEGVGIQMAAGIAEVIRDNLNEFTLEYPCHSPTQKRWFQARVTPTGNGASKGAVVMHIDISERKFAEEKIRKSEANLNAIIENTDAMIYSIDSDYRYITCNSLMREAVQNYSGLEIKVGTKAFEFLEDRDFPEARYWETIYSDALSGKSLQFIKDYSRNGIPSFISFSINPIREEKTIIGLSCFARDITEQKVAEIELRASEQRYRQISNNPILGIKWLSAEGRILNANEAFCKMLGYTNIEILDMKYTELIHQDDLPKQQLAVKQLFDGKIDSFRFEKRYLTKNRDIIWGEIILSSVKTNDGVVKYIIAVVQDITERKKAELALIESEKEIRSLAEAMPQIVWVTDAAGKNIYFNQHWMQYTGLKLEESYGDGWNKAFHPDDRQRAWEVWKDALNWRKEYSIECRLQSHDSSYRWWLIRGVPRLDENGNVIKWYGTFTDIEKLKQTETQINDLNLTLEQRVQERTASLTEANKELEAFSATVSHDLRAPARTIARFTEIIKENYGKKMEPAEKELFQFIEDSGNRMTQIIEDLLRLARYGNEKLKLEEVDMTELVRGIWSNITRMEPHCAELELQDLGYTKGDMSMIQQVVVNLISNAIKYSSKKEKPVVSIWCERKADYTIFYFKDNGAGFDMKNYNRLFGAFQRFHHASDFAGTGVGLTLVKRIVEKHGGTVGAEAKVGEGATFYFTLPVAKK